MDRRPAKIVKFTVDQNMAYLIQQVTGEPTQEILGYFHGIAQYVADDAAKNSKARRINKEVVLFYKETPIPYKMQVMKSWWRNNDTSGHQEIMVNIYFPKRAVQQDVTSLMASIMEAGLGLTETQELPKFEKPYLKTPKCLRDIRIKQNETRTPRGY